MIKKILLAILLLPTLLYAQINTERVMTVSYTHLDVYKRQIKHVVLAVNKMDLVGFSEERFNEIVGEYKKFIAPLGRCV